MTRYLFVGGPADQKMTEVLPEITLVIVNEARTPQGEFGDLMPYPFQRQPTFIKHLYRRHAYLHIFEYQGEGRN